MTVRSIEQGTNDPQGLGYTYETLSALIARKLGNAGELVSDRSQFMKAVFKNLQDKQTKVVSEVLQSRLVTAYGTLGIITLLNDRGERVVTMADDEFKQVKMLVSRMKPISEVKNNNPVGLLSENAPNKTQDVSLSLPEELPNKKVFVDVASEDEALLSQFKGELNGKGIKPIILALRADNDDPTETSHQLEHALDDCDEVIVFYKDAPLNWLMQRLRLYRKAAKVKRKDKLTVLRIRSPNNQPQGIKLPPNVYWETVLSSEELEKS